MLTQAELDSIRATAEARGMTVSSLVRAAVLGLPVPNRRTGVDAEAVAALNRVGVNLNQITKALHTGALTKAQVEALAALYRQISTLVQQIAGETK